MFFDFYSSLGIGSMSGVDGGVCLVADNLFSDAVVCDANDSVASVVLECGGDDDGVGGIASVLSDDMFNIVRRERIRVSYDVYGVVLSDIFVVI